jgi:hypothetical protein
MQSALAVEVVVVLQLEQVAAVVQEDFLLVGLLQLTFAQ